MNRLMLAIIICQMMQLLPSISAASNKTYTYDNLNRVIKVDYGNGTVTNYSYDNAGNRLRLATTKSPVIKITAAFLNYTSQNVGTSSTTQSVTVSNSGSNNLMFNSVALAGTNVSDFVLQDDYCSEQSIAPNGSCSVGIAFAPKSGGFKSARLSISSNDLVQPNFDIALSGEGIAPFILTYSQSGTGSGIVTSTPSGIACNTGCTAPFFPGTNVTLSGAPSQFSLFNGWSGACTNTSGNCTVLMNTDKTVTATFDKDTGHAVRIDGATQSYFSTILSAYTAAITGNTIKAWGTDFAGDLILNQNKSVLIEGGYNSGYTANTSKTILRGKLFIRNGKVKVENLNIR